MQPALNAYLRRLPNMYIHIIIYYNPYIYQRTLQTQTCQLGVHCVIVQHTAALEMHSHGLAWHTTVNARVCTCVCMYTYVGETSINTVQSPHGHWRLRAWYRRWIATSKYLTFDTAHFRPMEALMSQQRKKGLGCNQHRPAPSYSTILFSKGTMWYNYSESC